MRFIGQVAIPVGLFKGPVRGKMAFLFMTHPHVDGTWDALGGENAVVVQPGQAGVDVELSSIPEGPTVDPADYRVQLQPGTDEPAPIPHDDELDPTDFVDEGNKLGGLPAWVQSEQFPAKGWDRLLVQLNEARLPFWLNLGGGRAWVFLSPEGDAARMLWQR